MTANSFGSLATLRVGEAGYQIHRLDAVDGAADLPFSLKILLENLLRTEDGRNVTPDHISALAQWDPSAEPSTEIQFTPARVLLQDLTGVPAVVDLATMREAMRDLGGDAGKINPLVPAELVIDHSVVADIFGRPDAFDRNVELEFSRNRERFQFLRWGQDAFSQFKVVPPGTGIVHQVNIEHLARVVMTRDGAAYPDTCVGTDSHTTMQNGLGVLGWGVGGIEAEAAMLGQPISMLIPRVVGFRLTGELPSGATATDLVLTITELLRRHGVVGKFVEFYGDGVGTVPLANRATIGNMSPEFGSTCAIFPIDQQTLDYLELTGRPAEQVALVEAYAKEQGLWHDPAAEPRYSEQLTLDLSTVVPSLAGPKRPQDRVALTDAKESFREALGNYVQLDRLDEDVADTFPASDPFTADRENGGADQPAGAPAAAGTGRPSNPAQVTLEDGTQTSVDHGSVVIAAITSCTNTSNPSVMVGAALLAKKAVEAGLTSKPWVKTTLAPGSKVVMDYYERAGLVPVPGQARLQPGRLRLHHLHRQLRAAARGDQRRGGRERPRRGVGAVREPELRGPDQPRREDELPGLAAAGGRVRARRDHGLRHGARAARPAAPTAPPCTCATSGPRRPRSPTWCCTRWPRRCSPATTRTCSRATTAGGSWTCPRGTRSPGARTPPTCGSRRTSRA